MKTKSKIIFALVMLISQFVMAFNYVENRPDAIQAYLKQGVGAEYHYQLDNGNIRRMRVVWLQKNQNGGLSVNLEPSDNIVILDFDSDSKTSFESAPKSGAGSNLIESSTPESTQQKKASKTPKQIEHSSEGFEIGLETSVAAGVQVAMILTSGVNERISRAYKRIAELQKQIGDDFQRIDTARLYLNTSASAVLFTGNLNSPDSALSKNAVYKSQSDIKIAVITSTQESSTPKWLSQDTSFLARANSIYSILAKSTPRDAIEKKFYDISKTSLSLADQKSFLGDTEAAETILNIAKVAADIFVGLDPFTSVARSLYESVTGVNLVTGEVLSPPERALAALNLFTGGLEGTGYRSIKILERIAVKIAPQLMESFDRAKDFILSSHLFQVK